MCQEIRVTKNETKLLNGLFFEKKFKILKNLTLKACIHLFLNEVKN